MHIFCIFHTTLAQSVTLLLMGHFFAKHNARSLSAFKPAHASNFQLEISNSHVKTQQQLLSLFKKA